MQVRPATLADIDTICEFNVRLASETEGKTLDAATIRAGVSALVRDPAKGQYFLAEMDGRVVGQLAFTFEWSDWRNGWFWWIQSVYVHRDARKNGVFKALFEHLKAHALAEKNVIGIRLYVEDENRVAQATYAKLGMHWAHYRVMEVCPLL